MPTHHTSVSRSYKLMKEDLYRMLGHPTPEGGSHYTSAGTGAYSGLFFKILENIKEERPENEFICYSLYKAAGCECYIVPTILVSGLSRNRKKYWVQISPQEAGKDLAKMTKEQPHFLKTKVIDPENYSWHVVMTFLLYQADAKGDNYIVRETQAGYELVSIDHEMSLDEDLYPIFINVLFYYENEYEQHLFGAVREKLLQFDNIMLAWRAELETLSETELISKEATKKIFREVQARLQQFQNILRTREQVKHKELLEGVFPDIARYYADKRTLMKKAGKNPCEMTEQTIYNQNDQSWCAALCRRKELEPGKRRLLTLAAKTNHAGSIRELGGMYSMLGASSILENLPFSPAQKLALRQMIERKYYERAVDLGDIQAHYELARCLRTGAGGKKNASQARLLLSKAEELKANQTGKSIVPIFYWEFGTDVHMTTASPRYPWEQSSPDFIGESAMSVSLAQYAGISMSFFAQEQPRLPELNLDVLVQDNPHALELLEEIAHIADDPEAWYCLGLMYEKGFGRIPENSKQAIACLKKAADKNNSQAQLALGIRYLKGIGVKKNEQEALVYMNKSADHANPYASYNLFLCYRDGLAEIPRDIQQALFWGGKITSGANINLPTAVIDNINRWTAEQIRIGERVRARHACGIKRSDIAKQENLSLKDVIHWISSQA